MFLLPGAKVSRALASILILASPANAAERNSERDGAQLMQAIVANHFDPPVGRSTAEIIQLLTDSLSSPDSKLRDDLAFTILSTWIYEKPLLTPEQLRPLMAHLTENLRKGVGHEENDDVFGRSFSALTLSIVVARDNRDAFLRADEFRTLLDAALAYYSAERDTRGFDATKGWIHTVAHSSDLLKFLARSRHLTVADQKRILDAVAAKLAAVPNVFGQGEDERMARVLLSLLHRPDVDADAIRQWINAISARAKFPSSPDIASLRSMQNTRHLLTSAWAEISVDSRPYGEADALTTALKDSLRELF
jgi:hypothetical protein